MINDGYFPLEAQQVYFETPRRSTALSLPPSEPGDTLRIFPDTSGMFVPGTQTCRVYCPDSSLFNSEFQYYYPYEETPCYFNEFLFDPLPAYGQREFIELECGDPPCDLDRWVLRVNHKENLLSGTASQCYTVLADKEARQANTPGTSLCPWKDFPYFRTTEPSFPFMTRWAGLWTVATCATTRNCKAGKVWKNNTAGSPRRIPGSGIPTFHRRE
ncbi:MAG: hypothetical protein U5N26_00860 [Candidatus Marinimicrobia bacterium]|nr:hypothetical protein [Candidatus Neomarinimicrobiota bacterium]